jgi:hypothetical protein
MTDIHQNDKSLLEAIRRGDTEAWARLVDEYQGRLLRFAMTRVPQRADAEDIVQETLTWRPICSAFCATRSPTASGRDGRERCA